MTDKLKIVIGVAIGLAVTVILFCLIIVIGCSVNGLTFGEQVCQWFGGKSSNIEEAGAVARNIASLTQKL